MGGQLLYERQHMKLRYSLPSASLDAAFSDARDALPSDDSPFAGLLSTLASDPQAGLPHPVYVIDDDDLLEHRGLDAAALAGWRFLSPPSDQHEFALECYGGDSDHPLEFALINDGPFVAATRAALEALEQSTDLPDREFEVRLLKQAPLYLMALWLHYTGDGDTGTRQDLLIPLAPAPGPLKTRHGEHLDSAAFEELLFEVARTRAGLEYRLGSL
jgi:hypothetical protein